MSTEALYSIATTTSSGRTLRVPIKTGEMEVPVTGATTTHMTSLAPVSKQAYKAWVSLKEPSNKPHPHRGYTKKKLTRTQIKARRKKGRR